MSRLIKSIVHNRELGKVKDTNCTIFADPSLLVKDILNNEGLSERCIYCVLTPELEKHC